MTTGRINQITTPTGTRHATPRQHPEGQSTTTQHTVARGAVATAEAMTLRRTVRAPATRAASSRTAVERLNVHVLSPTKSGGEPPSKTAVNYPVAEGQQTEPSVAE